MMFILGLIVSGFLSEFIGVLHEMAKEKGGSQYEAYRWVILVLVPLILGNLFYFIRRDYIKPLDELNEKIAKVNKKK